MKLVATFAAVAVIGVTLIPEDANAQRRAGIRASGIGVRTVGAPLAYRTGIRTASLGWGYRGGIRTANVGWGYRSLGYRGLGYGGLGYRWGYAGLGPRWGYAGVGPGWGYRATYGYGYRPYWGWGAAAAFATAAYTTAAWSSPYYSYASYPVSYNYAYVPGYSSCAPMRGWVMTRWGYQWTWTSSCGGYY